MGQHIGCKVQFHPDALEGGRGCSWGCCTSSRTAKKPRIYAFSNYNPVVSFTFSAIALFVTTWGFLLSKKMMDARMCIMSEIQSGKQIDPAR